MAETWFRKASPEAAVVTRPTSLRSFPTVHTEVKQRHLWQFASLEQTMTKRPSNVHEWKQPFAGIVPYEESQTCANEDGEGAVATIVNSPLAKRIAPLETPSFAMDVVVHPPKCVVMPNVPSVQPSSLDMSAGAAAGAYTHMYKATTTVSTVELASAPHSVAMPRESWTGTWNQQFLPAAFQLKRYTIVNPLLTGQHYWAVFAHAADQADQSGPGSVLPAAFDTLLTLVPLRFSCISCCRPFRQFYANHSLSHWVEQRQQSRLDYVKMAWQDVLQRRLIAKELDIQDAFAAGKLMSEATFRQVNRERPPSHRRYDMYVVMYCSLLVADYKQPATASSLAQWANTLQQFATFPIRPNPEANREWDDRISRVTGTSVSATSFPPYTASSFESVAAAALWFYGKHDEEHWQETLSKVYEPIYKEMRPIDVE